MLSAAVVSVSEHSQKVAVGFSHTAPICPKKACEKGGAPLAGYTGIRCPSDFPSEEASHMLNLKAFDHLTTTRDCSGGRQAGRQAGSALGRKLKRLIENYY
jgi:hypothetical protein